MSVGPHSITTWGKRDIHPVRCTKNVIIRFLWPNARDPTVYGLEEIIAGSAVVIDYKPIITMTPSAHENVHRSASVWHPILNLNPFVHVAAFLPVT